MYIGKLSFDGSCFDEFDGEEISLSLLLLAMLSLLAMLLACNCYS